MNFPTVAQIAAQAYLRRVTSSPPSLSDITQFAESARAGPKLTDRGAVALYIASRCTGITVKDLEAAIQVKQGVIYAVLTGLHGLGLIEVRNAADAAWLKTVWLTDAGDALVRAAHADH